MKKLLTGRRLDPAAERVLFALIANRAVAPSSTLAATRWVEHDSHIPGLPATSDDACYRAMDWLLTIEDKLAMAVTRTGVPIRVWGRPRNTVTRRRSARSVRTCASGS
jgi:hypothetical protein